MLPGNFLIGFSGRSIVKGTCVDDMFPLFQCRAPAHTSHAL